MTRRARVHGDSPARAGRNGIRRAGSVGALATLALVTAACGGHHSSAAAPTVSSATTNPSRSTTPAPVALSEWPLTGLPRPSSTQVGPAISIKIDNVPAARPQAGLDRADVVFEALVEGGLSRFLAVYNSTAAPEVGPVRSARPVDGALLRALNGGIFGYSGAATGEIAPAKAYSTALLISNDNDPRPFHRDTSRRAPSNLFTSTAALAAEAARLGGALRPPGPLFPFGPLDAENTPVSLARIQIGSAANATWTWNGHDWLRGQQGTPDVLVDGTQISADNVLVLRVQVTHSGIIDAAGNEDPFVLAYGSGDAVLLRDGRAVQGHWARPGIADPYRLTNDRGQPLALTPGRTWVELVPVSGSVSTG